jgi:pyruvate dehydrogenase E1 component beta subunit
MTASVTMAKALNDGLRAALERDPKVLVMGEDVGRLGGVFRVTDGLQKDFGEQRVLDTPLAESGIIGAAVGLAIRGFRPVCEIQFDGFVFPGFDQIVSQLAKLHYRSQGRTPVPVVVRIPFGGGIGAVEHHSESPESLFAHVPGLKVVACATPSDAHWMLRQAIACDDPVIFFEPKRRYWEKGEIADAAPPLFSSRVLRPGSTATLACYGPMVRTCLDAAAAAQDDGHDLEVIDLRTLSPLDLEPVFDAVRRTGRLVVVSEAPSEVSVAAEVAARVQQECFHSLEAPVLRVTGFDTPYPPSRCEDDYLPDLDRVLDAVDRALAW